MPYTLPAQPYMEEKMAVSKVTGKVYPSHTRKAKRRDRLKELGWTTNLFDSSWRSQRKKCAICKKLMNLHLKQNEARACADHKHVVPPVPRGTAGRGSVHRKVLAVKTSRRIKKTNCIRLRTGKRETYVFSYIYHYTQ